MSWSFILTDQNFVPQGEILNMQERKVTLPLSKIDTCSFRVRKDNPMAQQLMTCSGYVKAFRDGVLRFYGPLLTAEEVADGSNKTISVNAVGQGWIFSRRYALKSVVTIASDRAVRFKTLLDGQWNGTNRPALPGPVYAFTNIMSSVTPSSASSVIYSLGEMKLLSTVLGELAAGPTGFDWRVLPVDNLVDGEVVTVTEPSTPGVPTSYIGDFLAAPTIGSYKENVFFEHGTGKHNLTSYKRVASRESQADYVYHVQSGVTPATIQSYDIPAINQWGVLDDVVDADLQDATLRQELTDAHVAIRKQPRNRIDFTPVGSYNSSRVPQFGDEFDVGDIVRARAVDSFDALFRIWGVVFDVDANGVEKMTLQVSEDAS